MAAVLCLAALLLIPFLTTVKSHGRLLEPPSRGSMWRLGFNSPANYADNQLFCGGFARQWQKNGAQCGVCGDPYDGPRDHEPGGKFYTGEVTRTYTQGKVIKTVVELTAFHGGWFEFRLCPLSYKDQKVKQSCFDENVLYSASGAGTRYTLPNDDSVRKVTLFLRLPRHLVCNRCILQWKYHAANMWGTDPSGRQCVGCGAQEEFYGCADIRILPPGVRTISNPAIPYGSSNRIERKSLDPTLDETLFGQNDWPNSWKTGSDMYNMKVTKGMASKTLHTNKRGKCRASGSWIGQRSMDDWCELNCPLGHCPATHCTCAAMLGPEQRTLSYDNQRSAKYSYSQAKPYSPNWKRYPFFGKVNYALTPPRQSPGKEQVVGGGYGLAGGGGAGRSNTDRPRAQHPYRPWWLPYRPGRSHSYPQNAGQGRRHYGHAQRDGTRRAFNGGRLGNPKYVVPQGRARGLWPGVTNRRIRHSFPHISDIRSLSGGTGKGFYQSSVGGFRSSPQQANYVGARMSTGGKKSENFELYDDSRSRDLLSKAKFVDDMPSGRAAFSLEKYAGVNTYRTREGGNTGGGCVATGAWSGQADMTSWCRTNCAVGNCPDTHCQCQ